MEIYHNDAVKVWQISEETICLLLSHYLLAAFSLRDSQEKLHFLKKKSQFNNFSSGLVYYLCTQAISEQKYVPQMEGLYTYKRKCLYNISTCVACSYSI